MDYVFNDWTCLDISEAISSLKQNINTIGKYGSRFVEEKRTKNYTQIVIELDGYYVSQKFYPKSCKWKFEVIGPN